MNQKGFIPIIIIVVGAVVIVSATFSMVKYGNEIAAGISGAVKGFRLKTLDTGLTGETLQLSDDPSVDEAGSEGQGGVIEEPIAPAESPEDIQAGPPQSEDLGGEEAGEIEELEEIPEGTEEPEEPAVESEEVSPPEPVSRPRRTAGRAPGDSTPPEISDIKVINITENSAVITWHTDEDSDSVVEYGLAPDSYDTVSADTANSEGAGFVHTAFLSGLSSDTVYYYKVISTDNSGNKAESEEDGFLTLFILATIDFDPDILNLKSKGNKWVTTYIELPADYDVNEIDLKSIRLNDRIQAETGPTEIGDYDDDGIPDLKVKYNKSAVQDILETGDEVEIIVTGRMIDGALFKGSDIIRVIGKEEEE